MFFKRLLGLFRRRDDRLSAEIQTHLDLLTEHHVDRGLTPIDARAAARREFGGVAAMKDAYRDQGRLPFFDVFAQDVRYALRTFRRAPAVTAAIVVTLALGMGATTAIFAIVDAVLLKPLPYPRADRMLALGSTAFGFSGAHTGQTFLYIRERVPAFARVAATRGGSGWNLVVGERAEYVRGVAVTPGYFEVFGMPPQAGREFSEAEGQPNGPMSVVISDAVWRRHFDGRADAIGAIAQLGGVAHAVVGVMPPAFRSIPPADVWTTLRLSPADTSLNYTIIGRLRNEASWESATAALEAVKPAMVHDLGATSQAFPRRIEQLTWMPYRATVSSGSRPILRLLFGAAIFVLLIACANVAALQLVRAVARRREMATRAALGGGTARAIRQLLTESLMLAILGALAGMAVAYTNLSVVLPFLTEAFLLGQRVSLDWRVFGAAIALAVATSLVLGVWPAIDTARLNLRGVIWEGGRNATASRSGTRLRRAFAVLEVCLAGVLLVGAGLFVRAIVNLTSVDVGFDPDHVLVAQTSLQVGAGGTGLERMALFDRILTRMNELPGVEAAAVATNVPIERVTNLAIEPAGPIRETRTMDWMYVSPDYFTVFRIDVRAGRPFDRRDAPTAAPAAIVNATFAQMISARPLLHSDRRFNSYERCRTARVRSWALSTMSGRRAEPGGRPATPSPRRPRPSSMCRPPRCLIA
jgi:predicted permease